MNTLNINIKEIGVDSIDSLVEELEKHILKYGTVDVNSAPIGAMSSIETGIELVIQLADTQAAAQLVESVFLVLTTWVAGNKIKDVVVGGKEFDKVNSDEGKKEIEDNLKR